MFKTPKVTPPPLEDPAPMPDPGDELMKKKKQQAAAAKVSGYQSTILSDSAQTLGGY